MDLFADVKSLVLEGIGGMVADGVLPEGLSLDAVTVEPPRDAAHGDMATNAAMVLAKPARKNPREIAEALAARLDGAPGILGAEVAGPGFLNLRLDPARWFGLIPHVIGEGVNAGRSRMGAGRKVNVEFVSANPTGPMHVGHTRGAVFGDALAGLLDFAGCDVTREYYINDGGAQVDVLARSVYLRYLEALGEPAEFPDGTYPGDYLIPVGADLAERYGRDLVGKPEADWLPELRAFATDAMMEMIRADLALLGVEMDVFFRRSRSTGRVRSRRRLIRSSPRA